MPTIGTIFIMPIQLRIIFIWLLAFISADGICQRPGGRPGNFAAPVSASTPEVENDTLIYTYSSLDNWAHSKTFDDTTLHEEILPFYSDIIPRNTIVNTGNLGSAAHNLIYTPVVHTGFHTGYDQYKMYNLNENNYKLFSGNKPVSDVFFSQFSNQQNIMAGAHFYRPFSDGISTSLNYRRISQAGLYNAQNTKVTNLGMSLQYVSPEEKYRFILTYLRNINEENNNGGITPGFNINDESIRSVIPTILNMATTRHQEQNIIIDQFYTLKSGDRNQVDFTVRNQTSYRPSYYKFTDQTLNTANDTLHYQDLLIDNRGIRRYVDIGHFRNKTTLSTLTKKGYAVSAGMIYDYFRADNNPINEVRHDVTVTFDGNFPVFKGLVLNTLGHLGVGQNIGNFSAEGRIQLNLNKAILIKGAAEFFRTEQSYASKTLSLNFENIYNTEFKKSLGSVLKADIDIPLLKLNAGLRQYIWDSPVYWDENARPVQKNGALTVTQVSLHQKTHLFSLVLENSAWLQIFSDDIYHLPSWMTHHRVYWSGRLFRKVLEANIGASARIIPTYAGTGYSPVWGQFYATDETIELFPAVDFFILAKVSKFRAVFTLENAGLLLSNNVNYDIARYPQFDTTLRFGFRWILLE